MDLIVGAGGSIQHLHFRFEVFFTKEAILKCPLSVLHLCPEMHATTKMANLTKCCHSIGHCDEYVEILSNCQTYAN